MQLLDYCKDTNEAKEYFCNIFIYGQYGGESFLSLMWLIDKTTAVIQLNGLSKRKLTLFVDILLCRILDIIMQNR